MPEFASSPGRVRAPRVPLVRVKAGDPIDGAKPTKERRARKSETPTVEEPTEGIQPDPTPEES